ncbi:MAG: 4-(cytidine 5'-diphospho)-2-C-methyl-D-erythritol kinase [Burkholderiaceae bacterium]
MGPPIELRNCPAPAKLNLFLHVLGQRDSGYHELHTAFDLINLQDTMHFGVRNDGAIMHRGLINGLAFENDLAVRAARLLAGVSETRLGANIDLIKRIPVGGGLGGGSSNAATALLALNRLWGINWPVARLARLALQLGADVPVFVHGTAALATGVGEILTPLEVHGQDYVLVAPPASVSTAEIFASPELTRDSKPLRISPLSRGRMGSEGKNDLEPVVCKRYPQVEEALLALNKAAQGLLKARGARVRGKKLVASVAKGAEELAANNFEPWPSARMSGSGACVFLPVPDHDAAQTVAKKVEAMRVGKVYTVRSLDQHPLRNWAFGRR